MVSPAGNSEEFDFKFNAKTETDPNFKQLPEQLRVISAQLKELERARSLRQLAADAAKVAEETGSTRQAVVRLRGELAKFNDITLDETRSVVKEFDRLTQAIERSQQAAKEAAKIPVRTPTADDRFGEVSRGVGLFGDFQSNLGALSSLTGIREIGVVGEIVALGEELPRLKAAAQGLPEQLRNVVSTIGAPGLGAIGGLAALAIAIKVIEDQAVKAREAAGIEIEGAQELAVLRQTLTTDELNAKLKEAQELRDIRQTEADEAIRIHQGLIDEIGPVGLAALAVIGQAGNAIKAPLDQARQAAEDASLALKDANNELENLQSLQGQLLENDIAAFEKELDDQRQKSGSTLQQLAQQEQALIDAYNEQTRIRQEDDRLNDRFQNEDRQLEQQARESRHQDSLAAIETAGQQRIEDLRTDSIARIGELEAKRDDTLAEIVKNTEASIADVRADSRRDELKAEADYQKERKRRLQDNAQELLDAELANDVAAFIAAKQRQQTEDERSRQDFTDEQRQRRAATEERIADIRREADERTRVTLEQFTKEKAAIETGTQQAIVKELAAIEQRTTASIEAYNRELAAREEAQQRADDRQAIRDGIAEARRLAAHNEQLANIEAQRQAQNGLLTDIIVKINAARLALATATNQSVLPQNPNLTSSTSGGLRAFANGTPSTRSIYGNRPGVGILNDLPPGWDEAIIPYRQGSAPMAGVTINYIHNGDISDPKVTVRQLRATLEGFAQDQGAALAYVRGVG